jgi:fluoroquinolone resistance protein
MTKTIRYMGRHLDEVDFTAAADLFLATFTHCDLSRATFSNTNLIGADFRSSEHLSLDPEANRIRKARFDRQNVLGLLDKYDIRID